VIAHAFPLGTGYHEILHKTNKQKKWVNESKYRKRKEINKLSIYSKEVCATDKSRIQKLVHRKISKLELVGAIVNTARIALE
jgi:hypothetical protein